MNISDDDIKIVLLGDVGVGKTNLMNVFFKQEFKNDPFSTTNPYCLQKEIKRGKNTYTYSIWDTAGQEKYRSITKQFIRDAKIILLVYAIDNRKSFDDIGDWINFIKENKEEGKCLVALIANKCDLMDKQKVSDEEGEEYAKKLGVEFLITSALLSAESFRKFVIELINNYIHIIKQTETETKKKSSGNIKINKKEEAKQNKKKKCCKNN